MRKILSLEKAPRNREPYPSLMNLCPTISYKYIGGLGKLVVQIPSMDVILMTYCVESQVSTMMISIMYKIKLRMGK